MADIKLLHSRFQVRIQNIMNKMQALGTPVWLVSTLRTPEEQAKLYSVGRGEAGKPFETEGIKIIAPGKREYPNWSIVTKAVPFKSAHNWGIAVDFGWIVNGKSQFDNTPQNWKKLYEVCQTEDCEDITSVVAWDKGHIQWKAWDIVQTNLAAYKQSYITGGMKTAWEKLDKEYTK